jgi:hypothetical protein
MQHHHSSSEAPTHITSCLLLPWPGVYCYLSDAMYHDYSGEACADISRAFQQHPLLWLPDKPYTDSGATSRLQEQLPGRFHHCEQCCFFDQTRTMEGLVHDKVTLRVLGPCYSSGHEQRGLKDFFTQQLARQRRGSSAAGGPQHIAAAGAAAAAGLLPASIAGAPEARAAAPPEPLIQAYPSKAAYCSLLEALVSQSERPTPELVNKVLAVLTMWAEGIAKGKLKVGGGWV